MSTTKSFHKRSNGEGTFYKCSKTGNWNHQVCYGRKPDGKLDRKTFSGKTQAECRVKRSAYEDERKAMESFNREADALEKKRHLAALRDGHSLESETLFATAFQNWLHLYKSPPTKKPTTFGSYLDISTTHFIPFFGEMALHEITQDVVQAYYNSRQKDGARGDKKKGALSPKTIRNHHMLLKDFFSYALQKYKLPFNPTLSTERPEVHTPPMRVLDPEEMVIFMREVFRETQRMAILFDLFSGLRVGELLALEVADIDTKRQMISVNKNIVRVRTDTVSLDNPNIYHIQNYDPKKKTQLIIQSTPKTATSNREVPINDMLFELIIKHLFFLSQSGWPNFRSLLFPSTKGTYLDPKSYEVRLAAISKRCVIKKVNPHALRHTLATRLCENAVALTTVKDILGHASVATTQKYVTTFVEQKREAMKTMAPMLDFRAFVESQPLSGAKKRMPFADIVLPTFAVAESVAGK